MNQKFEKDKIELKFHKLSDSEKELFKFYFDKKGDKGKKVSDEQIIDEWNSKAIKNPNLKAIATRTFYNLRNEIFESSEALLIFFEDSIVGTCQIPAQRPTAPRCSRAILLSEENKTA